MRVPLLRAASAVLLVAVALIVLPAASALASGNQQSMFEDNAYMVSNPLSLFEQLRALGVQTVRVPVTWDQIAPRSGSANAPRGFNAADPGAYPARNWAVWDAIDRDAFREGIALDFDPTGDAPLWALGPGRPRGSANLNWEPSPRMYGAFVHALAVRYSGSYDPARKRTVRDSDDLPRISFWSVWNEPDYGPSLAPQGIPGALNVENSPRMYRNLVDAAWTALQQTGHGADTFIFGEFADRDTGPRWGLFAGMAPLVFLRAMYCVGADYRPLAGASAALRGCPTTAAGSRAFAAQNPALFHATGVSDHPYMRWYPPDLEEDPSPDFASLAQIGNLVTGINRVQAPYGAHDRMSVWNTEFGYITTPPKHDNQYEQTAPHYEPWLSQPTAAYYLNWAEYLSWRNPRVASFMQYLLQDPLPATKATDWGGYASGLLSYNGKPKPTYYAWRLPLYLPVTSERRGGRLEVWGCARPARFAALDGEPQVVSIQLQPGSHGAFETVAVATIAHPASSCYFDVHVAFPRSGTVRLQYYDSMLGYYVDPLQLPPVYSRNVQIAVG